MTVWDYLIGQRNKVKQIACAEKNASTWKFGKKRGCIFIKIIVH